ncbi:Bacterial extracellular solute-binding proteins, family 5 Middle [Posidoniimonas corsicana]|uniref:Bacterial extracellular solute-binding proteins, family 5 Middle n=1 Tax=Posidoniimonas corsicana TaxID=1938618 RepID=A0A5C5VCR6_9BACT|nr:ABC transporter substrate-binding protein [Posidoniimonas corsicana]TWT35649.1 Bacterial extracellular solute-binding proteins, family 5 Middle [Posidoniimonas corsicana]
MHLRTANLTLIACILLLAAAPAAVAQDDAQRVVDRRPFDQVVLKQSAGGKTLEVAPLELPGRRVPRPFPGGRLVVRLLDQPTKDYEISWSDIQDVRLYEQMLISEASQLTKQKKFNDAFDYFAFLNKNYKNLPGLEQATAQYLQANALDAFQKKEYDQALAILLSLYDRNPQAGGIGRAVDTVANRIIQDYVGANNLRAARDVLDVVEKQFRDADLQVVSSWRARFKQNATDRVREGAGSLRDGDYRQARDAAFDALAILPDHPLANELLRRVTEKYPTMSVGVRTMAPRDLEPRIDSTASLRAGRVARRTITELSGYSPEGGVYTCPVGRVSLDDSGAALHFGFTEERAKQTPYELARWLLRASTPGGSQAVAPLPSLVSSVAVDQLTGSLTLELQRPHVRPDAMLRLSSLREAGIAPPRVSFTVGESTDGLSQFICSDPDAPIAELEERYLADDGEALTALSRGDVKLIDRLMPWQLAAVRRDRSLAVGKYELPTVHVLIPTHRNPLLDARPLRRAMLYAINREKILNELILGGRSELGFQVVSGPFPAGVSLSDPIRYGYNDGVEPRPYDPRLGALLSALSWSQAQRAEHGKEDPADRPFPTLRLAHNSDPVARTACQSIQMQLKAAGVPIEVVELSEVELLSDEPDFDLRYAELAVWEPLVDAVTLLGPEGVAGRCSDPMVAALKRLDDARNWVEVGEALRGVHALAAGDLPVLPLWQTVNFYAYRRDLKGPTESCVSLYQTLEGWQL